MAHALSAQETSPPARRAALARRRRERRRRERQLEDHRKPVTSPRPPHQIRRSARTQQTTVRRGRLTSVPTRILPQGMSFHALTRSTTLAHLARIFARASPERRARDEMSRARKSRTSELRRGPRTSDTFRARSLVSCRRRASASRRRSMSAGGVVSRHASTCRSMLPLQQWLQRDCFLC